MMIKLSENSKKYIKTLKNNKKTYIKVKKTFKITKKYTYILKYLVIQ